MRNFMLRGVAALAGLTLAATIGAAWALDRSRATADYGGAPGWVLPGAALDLNFVTGQLWQRNLGQAPAAAQLKTIRSTAGTAQDTAGNVIAFGSGVPRITNAGLLIEEARTNSQPYNEMAGAAFPSTFPTGWSLDFAGGLTVTILGTGTENGIPYIDINLTGTTGGASSVNMSLIKPVTSVAAANGQTWTSSLFWRLSGGSLANLSGVNIETEMFDSGGGFLAQLDGPIGLPSASALGLGRVSVTQTLNNASTAYVGHYLSIKWSAASLAINATLRIGGVQLEQGASATSVIFTNGAAVSRSYDFITVANPPIFAPVLSLLVTSTPQCPGAYPTTQTPLQLDDGTNNNRLDIDRQASTPYIGGSLTPGQPFPAPGSMWATGTAMAVAYAGQAGDQAMVANGVLATASGNSFNFTPSRIVIGANGNAQHQIDGTIQRVAIWPTQRLPNAFLAQVAP